MLVVSDVVITAPMTSPTVIIAGGQSRQITATLNVPNETDWIAFQLESSPDGVTWTVIDRYGCGQGYTTLHGSLSPSASFESGISFTTGTRFRLVVTEVTGTITLSLSVT